MALGLRRRRYKKPELPKGPFFLVDDADTEMGPFTLDDFAEQADNVLVCQTWGSPVFLRVTRQEGSRIWSENGAGEEIRYRVRPVIT